MAQAVVHRGSVVLIRYPFTDLTGAKVRPALVLTPDDLLPRLDDVLCLFISAVMPEDLLPTDLAASGKFESENLCADKRVSA